jgi:septal ring factor EnvC (AmiA/AmiB activator)
MFSFSTILSSIDFKIRKLIERCNAVERELIEVRQENQKLLNIIENQNEQIHTLEEQNKILILRNTLDTTKGDSAKVKLKINQLIRDIDRSIELLTKLD